MLITAAAVLSGCDDSSESGDDGGTGGAAGSGGSAGQGGGGGQGGSAGQGGSGGQGGSAGQGGGAAPCADRQGGALITFRVAEEPLTLWFTNSAFINEAIALKNQGETKVPTFEQVVDGQDCDPKFTFHVNPEKAAFADVTIELCDGLPSYVDEHTADWISQVKSYCPWEAKVEAVDDRRAR